MPRSNRPRTGKSRRRSGGSGPRGSAGDDAGGERTGGLFALQRTEEWAGEEWQVRQVAGQAGKTYRCPGCDQEIRPGTGHVVAWPAHAGADDRRHWHSACWAARDRRSAKVKRSRNAPRH